MIDQHLWVEPSGHVVRHKLLLEAKRRHAMYQPPLTLEAWNVLRAQLQEQILANLGDLAEGCPLDMREYRTIDMPTYSIKLITYQSRPGVWVTANLFVPKGAGPFSAILVVHGHWANGKASPEVQSRCHMFASEGFVVLAVDAFGSGERGTTPGEFEYHGANIGSSLLNIGQTLLGLQVNDNMRAIDLLQSLDCVDAENIGVTGASGGGNQTMWISALDERVKAAVPVVSVGTFEVYITARNCVCELLPNGLTFMEEWGVLGMIAPRPLLILNSLQDPPFFSVHEMIRSYTAAREVYKLNGVMDQIAYQGIDLPHGYWPEMQRFALGWFKRWLKGEGEGRACDVKVVKPLPYQDLLVFPNADRPAEVQSIYEFTQPIAAKLSAGHREDTTPLSRKEKVCQLETLLRMPEDTPCQVTETRTLTTEGLDLRCFQAEVEPGIPLPVELYSKAGTVPEKALIITHHDGMQAISRAPWMRELLEGGQALVFIDLRHSGCTLWDRKDEDTLASYHDAFRTTVWLGRTMIGEWVRDLLAVATQLKARCGMKSIDLFAYRDAGIAALCAAALSDQFSTVTTCETMATYVPEKCFFTQSMAVHIPKILHWGDVSMMAALANAEVRLLNPTRTDGGVYTVEEIAALAQELAALAGRLGCAQRVSVLTGTPAGLPLA